MLDVKTGMVGLCMKVCGYEIVSNRAFRCYGAGTLPGPALDPYWPKPRTSQNALLQNLFRVLEYVHQETRSFFCISSKLCSVLGKVRNVHVADFLTGELRIVRFSGLRFGGPDLRILASLLATL